MDKDKETGRKNVIILLFSCVMVAALWMGIGKMASINDEKAVDNLENAIVQSSVHCYAVEGVYPESLDYLKEHYGISYDEKKYVVKYEVLAQNIRPQVHVIRLGKQE